MFRRPMLNSPVGNIPIIGGPGSPSMMGNVPAKPAVMPAPPPQLSSPAPQPGTGMGAGAGIGAAMNPMRRKFLQVI